MLDYDVLLTSDHAPNGVGGFWWEHSDTVVSVPGDIAVQLLRIEGGGFHEAAPYKALPDKEETPEPAKKPGRPPKKVAETAADGGAALGDALSLVSNDPKVLV